MENPSEYERPHTVAGLIEKHKELLGYHTRLTKEAQAVAEAIQHVEAVLRLFEGGNEIAGDLVPVSKIQLGIRRFILSHLREAGEPLTTEAVTAAWIAMKGLNDDPETVRKMKRSVYASIKAAAKQGVLSECGWQSQGKGRQDAKLWSVVDRGAT